MLKRKILILLVLPVLLLACSKPAEDAETNPSDSKYSDYPIQPVNIREVKITDQFWLPIIKRVQEKTIDFALEKCSEEGRFDNFLIAGGVMEGETRGYMPFDDTDVYKTIEGMSNSLISAPNPAMEILLDSLIGIIARGQEEDGYLTTWRTINPAKPPAPWVAVNEGKRWESLESSHELYNAGHLYEAAAVHYLATGKTNFLDIATKNADLMVQTFGPGKIETVPGHQIIETGLIKLFRITGKDEYLELARYFLDGRGDSTMNRKLFGPYSQDHLPVTQQREVVGHAVRAVYMYSGMTDIATINKDEDYQKAVDALWDNMVGKKIYITGGIGARHEGESFGDNYELPNLTAYSETCAAIGSVYWNHRLFMQTGDVKYFDVIERTMYNGLISGLSLDGEQFFYPNALESDGTYKFNIGECTRQSWFDCSCCPTNLIRFIPSMPGLIYAKQRDTVYVNLYAESETSIQLPGGNLEIRQQTKYPKQGRVEFSLVSKSSEPTVIKFRVPSWARNVVLPGGLYHYTRELTDGISLIVDGQSMTPGIIDGYIHIAVDANTEKSVILDFPMTVRTVQAREEVEEDRGKVSLEYGPLVYAFEEIDNPGEIEQITLNGNEQFTVMAADELLGGVNQLVVVQDQQSFRAIPYYAWSNRGIGKMKVWIPYEN